MKISTLSPMFAPITSRMNTPTSFDEPLSSARTPIDFSIGAQSFSAAVGTPYILTSGMSSARARPGMPPSAASPATALAPASRLRRVS